MFKALSKLFVAFVAVVLFAGVSARASEMDGRIESSANKSYVFKTYLKDDSITTASRDGVVTLTGTVKEESHKSLAQETVTNLPGVKKVDNQLVYKGESPVENSDAWLAMKVKAALLFHRSVNAINTEVDVKSGFLTLKGKADSQAQKDLTGEYAKDVKGIKDVKNEMQLVNSPENMKQSIGEKIDDASITAQVKMALLSHRSTSAIDTKVSTNNGVVTLHGKAKNDAEKLLVGKLATDIKGVERVVNNMDISDKSGI